MATSDQEQKGPMVPQHKRMAAGAPVNGQQSAPAKEGGGLSNATKKK
jgi:hypothetical protein